MTRQLIFSRLILLFSGVFWFSILTAQTPTGVILEGAMGKASSSSLQKAVCNNAGTATITNHVGSSNDVDRDTIYLCAGDQILVDHNEDFDLSGDPDTTTLAGITYAFYTGIPTIVGDDLATIAADPNIFSINPILLPPGVNYDSPFWVTTHPVASNDVPFINDGNLQTFFNGGNPLLLWFAPITCDGFQEVNALGVTSFIPRYEGDPSGPCVNVAVDDAFAVVYLNPIEANNMQTTGSTGSFNLSGGLPQFNNSTNYTITASLRGNASVQGTVTSNGSNISVNVPEEGEYTITVSDDKSCPLSFTMTFNFEMANESAITFNLPLINIQPNDSECIDVTVENFNNVSGFQIPISWNPLPVRFDSITNFNPLLTGIDFGIDGAEFGEIRVAWADLVTFQPVTLPDDAVLFSLCFTARLDPGNCTSVDFELGGVDTIGFMARVEDEMGQPLDFTTNSGTICVSNDPLFLITDNTNVNCSSDGDGSISFLVSDGVAPYTYELRDDMDNVVASGNIAEAGGRDTINNVGEGTYTLIVVDAGIPGAINTVSREITIERGVDLGANGSILAQPACFGDQDGALTVDIIENTIGITNPGPEYSITWFNSDGDSLGIGQVLRDISAGTYEVVVSKDGCESSDIVNLTQPAPISLVEVARQDATCDGVNDGFLSVQASGGNTNTSNFYGFQWNITARDSVPSAQPVQLGGLVPGQYSLMVTDDNGCEAVDTFDIAARRTIGATATITDLVCFGGEDGSISVEGTTTGESAPTTTYTFNWLTNLDDNSLPQDTDTNSLIDSLDAGTYRLTILDQDGCTAEDTFMVVQPDRIVLSFADQQDATCAGGLNDGRLELAEPVGGTAPFTYVWDSIPNLDGLIAENLTTGAYTVVLTDGNGCQDSVSTVITAPDLPIITNLESDTLSCAADTDGQLTVEFQEGTSGAAVTSIVWSNGDQGESTSPTLVPGVYSVRVTDTNSCFAVDTAVVFAPSPLQLDSLIASPPTCSDGDDGSLNVFVSGGTPNYTFFRDSIQSNGSFIGNLFAGDYGIRVVDANNCPALTIDATVDQAPAIVVEFNEIRSADCARGPGACTGAATAIAFMDNGEQRTFDFEWSSGEQNINTVNSRAIGLCTGENTAVTVTDDGNCSVVASLEIPSPPVIIPISDARGVTCFGDDDGAISLVVNGGTPPFNFDWNNGEQTSGISGLSPDTYTVTITDGNDCIEVFPVTIGEPDVLVLGVSQDSTTANVSCAGEEDGIIKLSVQGGNGLGGDPFTWSLGVASPSDSTATDLSPGRYFMTVTDQNGCSDTTSYVIGEPIPIQAIIPTPTEPLCFGDQTTISVTSASGGNGAPYQFSVNNTSLSPLDRVVPVFGGQEVTISVFDFRGRGCSFDTTLFISQPPPVEVALPDEIEVQLGDSVRLSPDVFSTQPIDSIIWSPTTYLSQNNILNPTIRPINSGSYNLLIADANGCIGEAQIFVDVDKKRKVYIPNVFAPNSVFNSNFRVFTGAGVRSVNFIRIYDRWGELVYQAEELTPGLGGAGNWDGTFNGRQVPTGTYVYITEVEFEDDTVLLYRGDITVVY